MSWQPIKIEGLAIAQLCKQPVGTITDQRLSTTTDALSLPTSCNLRYRHRIYFDNNVYTIPPDNPF